MAPFPTVGVDLRAWPSPSPSLLSEAEVPTGRREGFASGRPPRRKMQPQKQRCREGSEHEAGPGEQVHRSR